MPFFDEASYSLSLRHHHTLASSFTSGLVFSPCGLYLASLSSSPRLTVTALSPSLIPSSHSSWRPVTSPGVARALAAGRGGLYVAGDFGLVRTAWEKENPTPVVEDVPVERICAVAGAIVGVVKGGWIVVVDEAHARPCAMLGGDIDVGCVAPVPDGTGFLAGCADGSIRQYDLRRGRSAVRTSKLSSSPLTTLVADADGTFALCGDASSRLHTAHLHSASPVASVAAPFLPRAAAFAAGDFYVGGSDRQEGKERDLLRVDFQCAVRGRTPVSAKSVYALATQPGTGAMAAAGYSPEKASKSSPAELVDFYFHPPVRSMSFEV